MAACVLRELARAVMCERRVALQYRQAGYEVRWVPYFEWDGVRDDEKARERYLRALIQGQGEADEG